MSRVLHRMGIVVLCMCSFGWAKRAQANDLAEQRNLLEMGIYLGAFFPSDSHEFYKMSEHPQIELKDAALEVGARFSYLPLSFLGAELEGGVMPTETVNDDNALLYHFRGHLIGQYPARLAPFLVVGGGLIGINSDALGNDVDATFHWGLGLKYYVTDWLNIRLDGRHIVGPDEPASHGATNHFEVLAGLNYVWGWKDEPKDSDGDGIADDEDKCPTEAGPRPEGCPPRDADNDGIADDEDRCPTEAGPKPEGCPPPKDTDGDGIVDSEDKCPTEAGPKPEGCPPPKDTDGDGIVDNEDKCPTEAETKNGYQDDDGCPDELPQAVKRFTGAIEGITFDTNKATIRPTSFKVLDSAVSVLKEYPDLKLIIRGHTDNRGKRERNLTLSQDRANAVRDYLVGKGIDANRIRTEGLGPDEPIADNKTAAGRAKNRRIEFRIDMAQ